MTDARFERRACEPNGGHLRLRRSRRGASAPRLSSSPMRRCTADLQPLHRRFIAASSHRRDSPRRAAAFVHATFLSLCGSPISKFDMISSARTIAE
ncbi:hypothetical protein WT60_08555 [Burkholderia sp. MSMB617WGS]|uniref:Uncharacterized protein n=1 Tax=Burkholderia savannae TaxID=1637837 RepID=A0ABR5TD13_9BURK|nr:hypothetical protein WS86_08420 [Burkholderia savannae]AOK46886.1 hypothetical protein WT60_08555 [Burkholderia sp. MSMB617WGS]KWZ42889.1 hypothetical protein WS72_08465 [Burkholderia savannae]